MKSFVGFWIVAGYVFGVVGYGSQRQAACPAESPGINFVASALWPAIAAVRVAQWSHDPKQEILVGRCQK